jgi:hypothetical protein
VPDASRWHALLLQRMTLDIEGVRPKLVGSEAFDCLDELRRFRRFFRSSYGVRLDPQRLRLVYLADFEGILAFLEVMGR